MNVTVHPFDSEGGKVLAYASVNLISLDCYISPHAGASGLHCCDWVANFCSHLMMLTWDFSSTLPLALIPILSLLIFSAKDTTLAGVLSLDIAVPVRSLNRLPHPLHK